MGPKVLRRRASFTSLTCPQLQSTTPFRGSMVVGTTHLAGFRVIKDWIETMQEKEEGV